MQRKPRLEKLSSDLFTVLPAKLGQACGGGSIVTQYPFTGPAGKPPVDILNDIPPGGGGLN